MYDIINNNNIDYANSIVVGFLIFDSIYYLQGKILTLLYLHNKFYY